MMEDEEDRNHQREVLEQVFGHSSSDEDSDHDGVSDSDSDWDDSDADNKNWEWIEQVKGLWILRNFLSSHEQSRLLKSIQSENWFTQPSINQAMRFGYQNLPRWAIKLSNSIHRSCSSSNFSSNLPTNFLSNFPSNFASNFPSDFPLDFPSNFPANLLEREPLFDQMITNFYQPGEGICPHIDLLRFEDGIGIVSLESSCVMNFSLESQSVPVLLTPGSLVFMFGDARYLWKHEINRKPGFQSWQGQLLNQSTRTSITLRKLCSSPET